MMNTRSDEGEFGELEEGESIYIEMDGEGEGEGEREPTSIPILDKKEIIFDEEASIEETSSNSSSSSSSSSSGDDVKSARGLWSLITGCTRLRAITEQNSVDFWTSTQIPSHQIITDEGEKDKQNLLNFGQAILALGSAYLIDNGISRSRSLASLLIPCILHL
jgi:hypothetical protein